MIMRIQDFFPNSRIWTFFILLVLVSCQSKKQGFLQTNGKNIVNEHGENVLLRGFGLGGWMLQEGYMLRLYQDGQQYKIKERMEALIGPEKTQEFYAAWLANHVRRIDIDSMKAWGFNSVRLPMHYNLFTLPVDQEPVKGQQTWISRGFEMTDSLLSWCKANELYLILDLHAAPGGQGEDVNISDRNPDKPSLWESEENQQKTIALWRKLAEHYSDEPWIGGYDIINEPNWGFENHEKDRNGLSESKNIPLRKLMVDITKTIREVDKNHIIIIEGNGWGNNYNEIFPLWDDNMVISFHKYWNYNDEKSIERFLTIRDEQNAPIWLGETGENSNVWFTQAINLLESHNIGWAWWPLKKIGFNNPLEIELTPEYQKLLSYWNGDSSKPSESEAYTYLMNLAESAKLEHCIFHKDVIDAMFRQVYSNEPIPFKKHIISNNSVINAVDYDLGRNGTAYFDMDTANYYISTGGPRSQWNFGRTYRNDGVDISRSEKDGSYFVYHIEAGEWLQYSIDISTKSSYTIKLEVSSENSEGVMSIRANGDIVENNISIPNTTGFDNWQSVEIKNLKLNEGKNKIKITFDQGGFYFKSLQFALN